MGQVALVGGDEGSERPSSAEPIELLATGLKAQARAGRIRAADICYDARISLPNGRPSDAIALALEHRVGDTVNVFTPYSKGRFGCLKFGDLTSAPGERRVFAD
jgi:hypothetical protein